MEMVEIEDLAGGELLDHAQVLATTRDRLEVEILRVAVQHAYLHNADRLDPDEAARPGRAGSGRGGSAAQGLRRSPSSRPVSWVPGWACRRSRPGC
jgi:hypothetical protein